MVSFSPKSGLPTAKMKFAKYSPSKKQYQGLAAEMRKQLTGEIIAIHIRRTDYLTNPNHEALGLDYYERALAELPEDARAIIFTDDPEWAKVQELFPDERFFVSETDCAYTDMALMALCVTTTSSVTAHSPGGEPGCPIASKSSHLRTGSVLP